MTEDQIREMTKDIQICWCNALVEQLDGGNGFFYWVHVDRGRVERDHAAIPAVLPWNVDELRLIANGLHTLHPELGDWDTVRELLNRVDVEIERREP